MKKGDARRQAIMETAERLFFDRGYENTSIQDILDAMRLSKGGFYHHFESKLQLLEEICARRAEASCERGIEMATAEGDDPIRQLNALFRHGGFFGEESIKFIALMLHSAFGGELSQLRERMRLTMIEKFEPVVKNIIFQGIDKQQFYVSFPDSMPRLIIMLAYNVTDEIATVVATPQPDFGAVMELLGAYRTAIETILNAPYGSLEIIDMARILEVLKALSVLTGKNLSLDQWNQQT